MSIRPIKRAAITVALILSAQAAPALAAPEEIQVYMDEMDKPGHYGLDVHLNQVPDGALTDDYPGEQQSLHRLRITPEFSYGITPNLEAGLYLPLATLDGQGRLDPGGVKGRLKFIAPRSEGQNWWWGANFEIGHVDHKLDINPWNAELKGIIGMRSGKWTLAENANVDFVVSGPQSHSPEVEFDSKIDYAVSKKVSLGVESYNGMGSFAHFGTPGASDQSVFAVADVDMGHWALNVGVGRGFGTNADSTIVKAILSVPLERILGRQDAVD
ncbi:MAG: hypothetical protein KGJ57_21395 [Sphingomonadales bacterium]|nr:hypothetical protein [Sphingomonadales bacterium]MDE2171949.1 hypothetical protein [Sphingomonadales bacterium]